MKASTVKIIERSLRVTSGALFFKGIVAGSVTALALFGVAVPYIGPFLGIEPHSALTGGVVATIGGLAGALLAMKA